MKESQFWLDGKQIVKEESVKEIVTKIDGWIDANLQEDEETGNVFWSNQIQIEVLEEVIKKILGVK